MGAVARSRRRQRDLPGLVGFDRHHRLYCATERARSSNSSPSLLLHSNAHTAFDTPQRTSRNNSHPHSTGLSSQSAHNNNNSHTLAFTGSRRRSLFFTAHIQTHNHEQHREARRKAALLFSIIFIRASRGGQSAACTAASAPTGAQPAGPTGVLRPSRVGRPLRLDAPRAWGRQATWAQSWRVARPPRASAPHPRHRR